MSELISHAELKSTFIYNKRTGLFRWKVSKRSRNGLTKIGSVAGCFDKNNGYMRTFIRGKCYQMHRLAWFYVTGEWPIGDIDHKNGVRHDNRFCNLRAVSKTINQQNRRGASVNCKSGLMGAWKSSDGKYWRSAINVNGKSVFLGYFKTAEQAHARYVDAKRSLHEGCTI